MPKLQNNLTPEFNRTMDEIAERIDDGNSVMVDRHDLMNMLYTDSSIGFMNIWSEVCIERKWTYKMIGRSIKIEKDDGTVDYEYKND